MFLHINWIIMEFQRTISILQVYIKPFEELINCIKTTIINKFFQCIMNKFCIYIFIIRFGI